MAIVVDLGGTQRPLFIHHAIVLSAEGNRLIKEIKESVTHEDGSPKPQDIDGYTVILLQKYCMILLEMVDVLMAKANDDG